MLAAGVGWAEIDDRKGAGRMAAARFLLLAVSCSSTCCKNEIKIFDYVIFSVRFEIDFGP